MRILDVDFDVSLNKFLNKPSYDVTVMDDLAWGAHHCLAFTMFQCIWNNHALTQIRRRHEEPIG